MNIENRKQNTENRKQRSQILSSVACRLFSFCCSGKRKNNGFTLIEVMVATVVLVVGVVVIFESFLISLDALAVFNNRLNAQWFFEEKICQIQSRLNEPAGAFLPLQSNGVISLGAEEYVWISTMQLVDPIQELYRVNLDLSWQQGNKIMKLRAQTMAKRYFDNSTP
ncbi:MAG: prepilin-type N-terminal cleavage/methylation domain-containing protein [Candidatus Omnitrophica bacterium]|nr:prepilin-type N-terminal cleavage/methylation domain-containing protein [Candidatus Omnitrophota bacterium]